MKKKELNFRLIKFNDGKFNSIVAFFLINNHIMQDINAKKPVSTYVILPIKSPINIIENMIPSIENILSIS